MVRNKKYQVTLILDSEKTFHELMNKEILREELGRLLEHEIFPFSVKDSRDYASTKS